jgi:hypothetical protein
MTLTRFVLLVAAGSLLVACALAQDPQEMNDKASALTKLTSHVDAAVIFTPDGRSQSDQALFDKAFEDNPTLKPYLAQHALRLQRGDKGVALMVCTSDGAASLLEDLSCTPGVDKHHWSEQPGRSCTFALNPSTCQ